MYKSIEFKSPILGGLQGGNSIVVLCYLVLMPVALLDLPYVCADYIIQ